MFAKFIAFEGADRVGKATQSKRLATYLMAQGNDVAHVEIPIRDGVTHGLIYWMLRNGHALTKPNLFQTVHFVNKFLYQAVIMPFHWMTCDYVILDRWKMSSIAYGGSGGANERWVKFMAGILKDVTHTVILDGLPYRSEDKADTYEANKELQETVRKKYRILSAWDRRSTIVFTEDDREAVHQKVLKALDNKDVL
jgi:thymidylate kinase